MSLLVGGQSGQLMNSGVLSGGRQDPPAKRFARDPCRLGSIWESLKEGRQPPAPPGAESKNVSPLTEKTVGERTLGFFSLIQV